MPSTALILFAHGSVLCGSSKIVEAHVRRLRAKYQFDSIDTAYLNYSTPLIEDLIADRTREGITRFVIVPYFLVAGKFALGDLPDRVSKIRESFPQLAITITPGLAGNPLITKAIVETAFTSSLDSINELTASYPADCELKPGCPLYGSSRCKAKTAGGTDRSSRCAVPAYDQSNKIRLAAGNRERALLIVAHGSPRPDANHELYQSVAHIRNLNEWSKVELAFLECNAPTIPEAIETLAASGEYDITVVPAFLHAGRHVILDIPCHLASAASLYPWLQFNMKPCIGVSSRITEIIDGMTHSEE